MSAVKRDKIRHKQNCQNWEINNKHSRTLIGAKSRAKKKGLEFSLTKEDVEWVEICPVFGVKLEYGVGVGPKPLSPSLDRIDSSKGYVKGNVQILSNKANVMKHNATPEELIQFAEWILKTYKEEK
jgi:hypothetical protein